MFRGIHSRHLVMALLCSIALPATASNFGLMKNTLPSQLSDSEMQQLKTEINRVPEENPDKKSRSGRHLKPK